MKLSAIADEFKQLDLRRRDHGLTAGETERYRSLFERLSEALTANEKRRKADTRQFLRVQAPMELILRRSDGPNSARVIDFGGGGCSLAGDHTVGEDLWIDGVVCDGVAMALHGRAEVVWMRDGTAGVRFAIDCDQMRDQVDRILYRVLDLYLHPTPPQPNVAAAAAVG